MYHIFHDTSVYSGAYRLERNRKQHMRLSIERAMVQETVEVDENRVDKCKYMQPTTRKGLARPKLHMTSCCYYIYDNNGSQNSRQAGSKLCQLQNRLWNWSHAFNPMKQSKLDLLSSLLKFLCSKEVQSAHFQMSSHVIVVFEKKKE